MKRVWMLASFFIGTFGLAQAPEDSFPPAMPMKQLMVDLIHPASNDILLAIYRGGPSNESEWAALRRNAATLAESGSLLTMRGRARDQGEWIKDVKMLVDAGNAAYKSAQAKDLKALAAVAAPLDMSCLMCHKEYRPNVFPQKTSR